MDLDFPGPRYTTFVLTFKQKEGVKKKSKKGASKKVPGRVQHASGKGYREICGLSCPVLAIRKSCPLIPAAIDEKCDTICEVS